MHDAWDWDDEQFERFSAALARTTWPVDDPFRGTMDSDIREALVTILQRLDRIEARLALLDPKTFLCPHCGFERQRAGRLGSKCLQCGRSA